MNAVSRVIAALRGKSLEGEYREGPYLLSNGWLPAGSPWNFWQTGQNVRPYGTHSAIAEACIAAYAQTIAMCPGDHWRRREDGGRDRVTTSALTRILRKPNDYQSISDFLLNLARGLYTNGNAYALALRNARFEISELHLMDQRECHYRLGVDGSIFYDLGGNEIVDKRIDGPLIVPARDVLHVRLHTPRHPLRGETPMLAAALEMAAGDAMMQQQLAFFSNQARPSIVLTTDQILTREQVLEARERWDAQAKGLNAGGTPITTPRLKPIQLAATSEASQLAEMLKMSTEHVALAFRVPLAILGIGGQTYSSTEILMQQWIASGLGFALNHIEEAFGQLFGLVGYPEEYLELNTSALLRSAFKDRLEGLARGVQAGIYSIDDARNAEDFGTVPGGDEPRVQQQMVPLSYGAKMEPPTATPLQLPKPAADDGEAEAEADKPSGAQNEHVAADILARINVYAGRPN